MNKKWRVIAASFALATALAAGGTMLALDNNGGASVYASSWSEYPSSEEKSFGSDFTVPERTVTVGDKTVTADSIVIYPDGSATTNKQITFSMSGVYKIIYSAEIDGKPYYDEVSIKVDDAAYFFSGEKSSAAYGKYKYAESDEGLLVRLGFGESITFNTPINVKDVTKFDALVECFVTPDEKGVSDFERLYFTFTDVEDPSVYLRISVRQSAEGTGYPISYALAGGNDQPLEGWEEYWKRLHVNNEWGTQFRHSFSLAFANGYAETAPDKMKISLRYDAATCQTYASSLMIIDHDDPAYFNKLWRGFKSDKVKLTVSADMTTSETANFCLTMVKGIDLKSEKFIDNDAPVITVDGAADVMPLAKVGASYDILAATAYDAVYGATEVKTSVWYNYGTDNQSLVNIKDGKFVPERSGDYAIVYESSDRLGNVALKTLWVKASKNVPVPVITISGDKVTAATAGETVEVADYTASAISGAPKVKITATLNGEEIEINDSFRPEKTGEYTITYTATDHIGQAASESYTLTVTAGDKPLFIDELVLPTLFIENCNYTVPDFYATDYRSGSPVKVKATLKIKDATGTNEVTNGVINVSVENNFDTVAVIYECDGANLTREVPVVKPFMTDSSGRLRLLVENYLYGNGFNVEKTDNGFIITATDFNGGFVFANLLPAENSVIGLKGIAGKATFNGITVNLEDAYDKNQVVAVKLTNNGSRTNVIVNGVTTVLQTTFGGGENFTVGYQNGAILVNGASVNLTAYENGEAFKGFASGKVKLSVYFDNAKLGSQFMLTSVNDHPMSSATTDRIGPKVVIFGNDYGGTRSIGSTVTLPAATAGDTLDPNVKFSLKVTDPNRNVVTSVDGITLNGADPTKEYTIKVDVYGQYLVTYTAEDTFNQRTNTTTLTYAINVLDEVKPEIKFAGEFKQTVKVGETMVIPSFTVSDNVTAAEDIRITKYVLTPSGVLVTIPADSNSVKATQSGKYEFRIIATDGAGNATMVKATVTVE